jgi:hypothetical protein
MSELLKITGLWLLGGSAGLFLFFVARGLFLVNEGSRKPQPSDSFDGRPSLAQRVRYLWYMLAGDAALMLISLILIVIGTNFTWPG